MGSGRNLNSFKLSCMSSLPARMKTIQSKMNGLEWLQHFSHYKFKRMFPDAQGQITPKSVMVFGRNLNSSKHSCMSSLHARMKIIQSNMKALEWSQHFPHYKSMEIFPDAQGQQKDLIKNESARKVTRFSPL